MMLFDPARHESLNAIPWDESRARATIVDIVRATERKFSPQTWWPLHPMDADDGETEPALPLYHGAVGVIWALAYLDKVGAAPARRDFTPHLEALHRALVTWLAANDLNPASFLLGETACLMLTQGDADRLHELAAGNVDHPTRELLWGAPGTMLAALFMWRRTGEARWADVFRTSARMLWSQLLWSPEFECRYWTQDMYGRQSTYIDAGHGFVGNASVVCAGRDLLTTEEWQGWRQCIVETVTRTAIREGPLANWRAHLYPVGQGPPRLMQWCHGSPGFVTSLADMPGPELDAVLIAAGEATWAAGPLTKGANLCHGTAGNGYAFLKLFERTRDPLWLERARAFAMHAIMQHEYDRERYGGLRYSLMTGDPGTAIYLWDCIRGAAAFPTIDVFYAG